MKHTLLILTAAVACVALAAHASYLEEPDQVPPMPPRIIRPRPQPRPADPLTDALRALSVERGHTHRGLTVFPLTSSRVTDSTSYLSLDDALADGLLDITEKGGGSVPVLLARNTSKEYILLLAGEVLTGGKQNRTLGDDVLMPPRSGWVELPVYCVERGRWHGSRTSFKKNPAMAGLQVRVVAQAGASQEAVWSNVNYYHSNLKVSSDTDDLQAVNESPAVRKALDDYAEAFADRWPRDAVGMVVARHGRIVGADIFCNRHVFRRHRERLLESYALDCHVTRELHGGKTSEPSRRDAERFLERAIDADHEWASTPGHGRLLRVRGARVTGIALVRDDAVVHAGIFARDVIVRPIPLDEPRRSPRLDRAPEGRPWLLED